MLTLKDIAEAANVSVFTVSSVLNNKTKTARISEQRAREVRAIAARMGYRPSAAARAVRTQRTRQVGILVPNNPGDRFTHPLAYETVLGINEGLQTEGYVAVMARIDDVESDLASNSRVFQEHMLDGMIVMSSMPTTVERCLEALIPCCVWCDSNVWRQHGCVRRDEFAAGERAGQAACDAAPDRIVMLTYRLGASPHFSTEQRLAGVHKAVLDSGIELQRFEEPMPGDAAHWSDFCRQLGTRTVVVCNSVYQALAARSAAEERDLIPGKDFGLVCCDGMHQLDRLWPGLSRVEFDRYGMGLAAADMMRKLIGGASADCPSKILGSEWVKGNTVRHKDDEEEINETGFIRYKSSNGDLRYDRIRGSIHVGG